MTSNIYQSPCVLLMSRKTVPLTGTSSKVQASLDFTSNLALSYAGAWLHRAGGFKVPSSGVVRRALALYVQHLSYKDTTEALEEFKAVQRACRASPTPQDDQEAALQRLEGMTQAEPLPSFEAVLYGPQWASEQAASRARYEQLIADTMQSRRGLRQTNDSTHNTEETSRHV